MSSSVDFDICLDAIEELADNELFPEGENDDWFCNISISFWKHSM